VRGGTWQPLVQSTTPAKTTVLISRSSHRPSSCAAHAHTLSHAQLALTYNVDGWRTRAHVKHTQTAHALRTQEGTGTRTTHTRRNRQTVGTRAATTARQLTRLSSFCRRSHPTGARHSTMQLFSPDYFEVGISTQSSKYRLTSHSHTSRHTDQHVRPANIGADSRRPCNDTPTSTH